MISTAPGRNGDRWKFTRRFASARVSLDLASERAEIDWLDEQQLRLHAGRETKISASRDRDRGTPTSYSVLLACAKAYK